VFSLSDQPFQAGTNTYSGLVNLVGIHTNDVGRLRPIYKALRVKYFKQPWFYEPGAAPCRSG